MKAKNYFRLPKHCSILAVSAVVVVSLILLLICFLNSKKTPVKDHLQSCCDTTNIKEDSVKVPESYFYIDSSAVYYCRKDSDRLAINYKKGDDGNITFTNSEKTGNANRDMLCKLIGCDTVTSLDSTVLPDIIRACDSVPKHSLYCIWSNSVVFVNENDCPHYLLNKDSLNELLKFDEKELKSILKEHNNIFDFLISRKYLRQIHYGYADQLHNKLYTDTLEIEINDSTQASYKQLYDSLCKRVDFVLCGDSIKTFAELDTMAKKTGMTLCNFNDSAKLKENIPNEEESVLWVLFLVIFIVSIQILIILLIVDNLKNFLSSQLKNFLSSQEFRELFSASTDISSADNAHTTIGSNNQKNESNSDLVSETGLFASEKELQYYKDCETLYKSVRNLCGADKDNPIECSKTINKKLILLKDILNCKNGEELNTLFESRKEDSVKYPSIETFETLCKKIKNDDKVFQELVSKINDRNRKEYLNSLLKDYESSKSICDKLIEKANGNKKKIKEKFDEINDNHEQFLKIKETFDSLFSKNNGVQLLQEYCQKFEESKKDISDCIKFADNLTCSQSNDLLDKVTEVKEALSDYRKFIEANDKNNSLTPDKLNDVMSQLIKRYESLAVVAGYPSDSFAKFSELLRKELNCVIGGYKLCETFTAAHKENKACEFDEKNKNLFPEFAQSMSETSANSIKYKEANEFFNEMYKMFVEDFYKNKSSNENIGWFFEHVLNIAFHSADFIAYVIRSNSSDDISSYENYQWFKSGLDKKSVDEFRKNRSFHSTPFSNRLLGWVEMVGVKETKFLVDKQLIKP